MQAGDVKLGAIFFDNHRYEIPMFQRPYVWGQERNWLPLWNDISAAADGVVDNMHSGEWPEEPPTYFLGAIVVKATSGHPQRLGGSILVDGQQRLTTLQVMLAAARAVATEVGATSAAGRFDTLVENSEKAVHEKWPNDKYKLWPLPQDRPQYLWAVRRPDDQTPCPDLGHRISEARLWFEEAIRVWAMGKGGPSDRLEALHSALETRIALVRITLEKTDNAQVIFEALNHRGVDLSQSDLVKNLLFRLVEEQGERHLAESLLVDHWLPLDGREWRAETVTGRIKRSRLDQVIAFWLTARTGDVIAVDRLFDAFKAWLLETGLKASDVIKEIRAYADLYDTLVTEPPNESIAALVDLVIATKTNTVWPLILGIYGDGRVSETQREKASAVLASYLTRRMLCGLTTKDYNRLFVSVLQKAHARTDVDGRAGDAIEEVLAGMAGETRIWPDDGEFFAAIGGSNFYALARPRQRVFFAGIENHLRDDKTEDVNPIRARWEHLNIEHVMPQNWQDHWPLPDEFDEELRSKREQAINRVGNLTLTNGRLNSQLSNQSWLKKKPALQAKSTMLVTTASVLSAPPGVPSDSAELWAVEWNESQIGLRSAFLSSLALQVWPRSDIPSADYKDDAEFDSMDDLDEDGDASA